MSSFAPSIATRLTVAAARMLQSLGDGDPLSTVSALEDESLLGILADAAEVQKALDLNVAAGCAEVSRRSVRDLGYDGLAQRKGHRNATSLVQNITGQPRRDVTRAVKTGEELAAGVPLSDGPDAGGANDVSPAGPPPSMWLSLLREALSSGRIGQAQFHAVRVGLGDPPVDRYPALDPDFLPSAWAEAVVILLNESGALPVEELRAASRVARDRLDPIGVTLRFEERFAARSYRMWTDEKGQQHARIDFDDEAAAWVQAILQAALRPRRGPRFVGADAAAARSDPAAEDPRSNEQLQYDTIVAILRTGANADPNQAFGGRQPGVRMIIEAAAVIGGGSRSEMRVTGVGHLEDGGQALPGAVIEKYLCDAGVVPVIHDDYRRPLDVGREQRLFSGKQRIAIAARDGGCIWPSCTAPPSQCEYHHLDHWWRDHGRTDVDDGVPLCRNCHLRAHNQGWRITRERDPETAIDTYWLHGPADPVSGELPAPIRLASKSPRRFAAA